MSRPRVGGRLPGWQSSKKYGGGYRQHGKIKGEVGVEKTGRGFHAAGETCERRSTRSHGNKIQSLLLVEEREKDYF